MSEGMAKAIGYDAKGKQKVYKSVAPCWVTIQHPYLFCLFNHVQVAKYRSTATKAVVGTPLMDSFTVNSTKGPPARLVWQSCLVLSTAPEALCGAASGSAF